VVPRPSIIKQTLIIPYPNDHTHFQKAVFRLNSVAGTPHVRPGEGLVLTHGQLKPALTQPTPLCSVFKRLQVEMVLHQCPYAEALYYGRIVINPTEVCIRAYTAPPQHAYVILEILFFSDTPRRAPSLALTISPIRAWYSPFV
jgi:hypothetical protein